MVPQPKKPRSYALLGALIGIATGFIIGLIIHKIEISVFFCGLAGAVIGSFKMMQ